MQSEREIDLEELVQMTKVGNNYTETVSILKKFDIALNQ